MENVDSMDLMATEDMEIVDSENFKVVDDEEDEENLDDAELDAEDLYGFKI